MIKKIFIFLLVLILSLIISIIIILHKTSQSSTIKSRQTAYTYNCGWVDWKHAKSGGMAVFFDDFSEKFAKTPLNGTFKITYGQKGGLKEMGYSIFSYSISREYKVFKSKADEMTKKKLIFQIFKDMSYLFENYQKEIFWGALKSSAFREGDLMGNLISFYIACGEITKKEASILCEELSVPISLKLKKEGKFQINTSFAPKYRMVVSDNSPIFPMLLMKYNHLENSENYIVPLEKMETLSILGM